MIDSTAPTQQTVLRDLGDDAVDAIVTRWTDAWQAGDVDAIVAMLADDARFSMPPLPEWYRGPDEIRAFLIDGPLQSRWRFLPTTANGQLAFGTYLWDDARAIHARRSRRPDDPGRACRRGDRVPQRRPHPVRAAGAPPGRGQALNSSRSRATSAGVSP